MKNKYILSIAITVLCMQSVNAQFGPDVKTYPYATLAEGRVSMDIAYNGWIYEAFSIPSGFIIVTSRDNGNTWLKIDSVAVPQCRFNQRFVVAGTDSNYLRLYQVVDRWDSSASTTELYVNIYDATNRAWISNTQLDTYNTITRGIAIATDYKFPSAVSAPYSIGVAYAKSSAYDSLFIVVSTDSAATYGAKTPFASTLGFFRNISIAYGISGSYSDGRFFLAWDQYNSSTDTVGNLYSAYTPSYVTDVPAYTVNLDSLYPTTAYQLRNPVISCSASNTDNDSGNITTVIAVERVYTGLTNSNILDFTTMSAVYGAGWRGLDAVNTTDNTIQPDISFDPALNNFLLTYYDQTTNQLPYIVNNFNTMLTNVWGVITNNYVNDTTKLVNPWPTVRINPMYTRVGFGWNNTYNGVQQAMYDAEYRLPVPVITSLSPDTVLAGNTTFTLTVNGQLFDNISYIMWNTDSLGTTYVNNNQLTASILSSAVANVGTAQVTVVNPGTYGGGGTSNSVTFYIVSPLSVNNIGPNSLLVFPNPTSGQLNISYAFSQQDKLDLNLYDMSGRLVKQLNSLNVTPGTGTLTEDVSELAQGLYQLQINTTQGSTTRRISVVK